MGFQISDEWPELARGLSDKAYRLFVEAGANSARYGLNGAVPRRASIVRNHGKKAVDQLVASGYWANSDNGGYEFTGLNGSCRFTKDPLPRRRHVPKALRAAVMERDGHRCRSCGAETDLALDHIQPRSRGGRDTFENFQVLCKSCNSHKGASC